MSPRARPFVIAALLLLTAVVGALRVQRPSPPADTRAAIAPDAEAAAPYDPSDDLAVLQERAPFGVRAAARTNVAPASLLPWRVVGVLHRADGAAAALLFQPQNRLEYRRVGETLPDGRRIRDIGANSISVEADGVTSTLPLFTGPR